MPAIKVFYRTAGLAVRCFSSPIAILEHSYVDVRGWWDYLSFYPKCQQPSGWSCKLESAARSTVMSQDTGRHTTGIVQSEELQAPMMRRAERRTWAALPGAGLPGPTARRAGHPHRPSVCGTRRAVRQGPRPGAARTDEHGWARQPARTSRAFPIRRPLRSRSAACARSAGSRPAYAMTFAVVTRLICQTLLAGMSAGQ